MLIILLPQRELFRQSPDCGRTFGGEVEGCSCASSGVGPVHSPLPVRVLVVIQHAILVLARVPVLHSTFWVREHTLNRKVATAAAIIDHE